MTDADAAGPDVAGTVFDDEPPEVARTYAEALAQRRREARARPRPCSTSSTRSPPTSSSQHPKFAEMLASPPVPRPRRTGSSSRCSRAGPRRRSLRFLRVLNRHGRLGLLAPIAREARAIWDRRQNRRPGHASARPSPLDDGQQAALRDQAGRDDRRRPRSCTLEVDPVADRRPGRPGRRRRLRRLGPEPARTAPPATDRREDA